VLGTEVGGFFFFFFFFEGLSAVTAEPQKSIGGIFDCRTILALR